MVIPVDLDIVKPYIRRSTFLWLNVRKALQALTVHQFHIMIMCMNTVKPLYLAAANIGGFYVWSFGGFLFWWILLFSSLCLMHVSSTDWFASIPHVLSVFHVGLLLISLNWIFIIPLSGGVTLFPLDCSIHLNVLTEKANKWSIDYTHILELTVLMILWMLYNYQC